MIETFFGSDIGLAVYTALALTLVNFVSGVAAAYRDNTLSWQAIDAFIRSHLMGRVVPIFVLLFAGQVVGGDAGLPLFAAGIAAVAAYLAATVATVIALWANGQVKDVPDA